jgi:hypothetical protein
MIAGRAIFLAISWGELGFPHFPEIVVSAHCLPSRLTAMSEGEARPALEDELGRVLINAQIAAPLFMGHLHRLSKKLHSLLSSIRRIIQTRGHSCAHPRPSRRLGCR